MFPALFFRSCAGVSAVSGFTNRRGNVSPLPKSIPIPAQPQLRALVHSFSQVVIFTSADLQDFLNAGVEVTPQSWKKQTLGQTLNPGGALPLQQVGNLQKDHHRTGGGCPLAPSWCDRGAQTAPALPELCSRWSPGSLQSFPGHRGCSACLRRLCQLCLIPCHHPWLLPPKLSGSLGIRDPSAGPCPSASVTFVLQRSFPWQ